jgi:PAS domain-containing protein
MAIEDPPEPMAWPTATVTLDAAGRYVDANQPALDLLGVSSVEALRAAGPETFAVTATDPEESAAFQRAYAESAARGLLIESAFRRTDGELVRARSAILPDGTGGYRAVFHPIERPTTDVSWRIYTIADVLAEWRSAERRLVELDPGSDAAARVTEQIELFREQYRRMFDQTAKRSTA